MTHAVIIIKRVRSEPEETTEPLYTYEMPVPHNATPAQVGVMVRKAFKRLEGADDDED